MAIGIIPIDEDFVPPKDLYCAPGLHVGYDENGYRVCVPDSPPPPPSDAGPCGFLQRWDSICQQCVPDGMQEGVACDFNPNPVPLPIVGDCPAGFVYSAAHNACVPDNAPTVECPLGTAWSQQFYNCVPIAGFPQDQPFDPGRSLIDGMKEWAKANPALTAGLVAGALWLASGRKIKPLRKLL